MKTPFGTEVDLGPGHIVLDRSQLPQKGHSSPPLFGPCLLWPRSPISATAKLLCLIVCHSRGGLSGLLVSDNCVILVSQVSIDSSLCMSVSLCLCVTLCMSVPVCLCVCMSVRLCLCVSLCMSVSRVCRCLYVSTPCLKKRLTLGLL